VTIGNEDAWAVGYIPQLAVGIWVGHTQNEISPVSGEIPATLWHAIIQYASRQMPVENFQVPSGISTVQVCDPSGLLPSILCPAVVQEYFLSGNEPTQVDNLYQKFYINRETGLLATIFTPPELVEEQVYLVIPPQAVPWAQEAGLPIPPDSYDVIYAPPPASPNVRFTSPQMFAHVGGRIEFFGSAAGTGFSYYRLQIGQGLNPQQWIQIGQDVNQPVEDGLLGTWDTQGLEGLYVVQLMVVRQDQRVERAILQITVDNTLPQVQIINPTEGEQFTYQQGESILLQVSASDNLVVDRVEFYIDDTLVSTLQQPPYVVLWSDRIGEHSLLVRAYDLAGNLRETAISFSVHR
jgi:membrane carboxypeptidase/penicillin-binding protein PbpC